MQMCDKHWAMLREEVRKSGYWHMVPADGQEAITRIAEAQENGENPKTYDPLTSAMFMIYGNALKQGGLYLMGEDENGKEYCPICEAIKHLVGKSVDSSGGTITVEDIETYWIAGPVEATIKMARGNGLLIEPTRQ